MANLNKVLLMGNLTRDPELRFTQSGQALCNFRIAVNRTWKGRDGNKQEETTFLNVKVWGKQGENCANFLKKGRPVFLEGRISSRQWETDEGQKRTTVEVVAERVQFLGGRSEGAGRTGGARDDYEEPPEDFDVEDDIPF